jgi:competence protein ComEA
MSAPSDLDDPFACLGGDLPRRPPPPRTWRDRLDDIAAVGVSPARVAAGLAALVVAAVVAWRLLAPPAPPPEVAIPFTEPQATVVGATGRDATTGPAGASGVSGASGPPPTGPTGASGAPASGGAAAGTEVVVHVVGAVAAPGVQRLPAGARVVDAVDAAGGAAADADLGRLNLAAVLADGQQVYVLRVGESPPTVGSAGTGPTGGDPGAAGAGSGGGAGALVDINTATAAELEELPGVGPTTAEAIIAHRERNGPFVSVDDLLDVRGIGDAKLEQLRERATV